MSDSKGQSDQTSASIATTEDAYLAAVRIVRRLRGYGTASASKSAKLVPDRPPYIAAVCATDHNGADEPANAAILHPLQPLRGHDASPASDAEVPVSDRLPATVIVPTPVQLRTDEPAAISVMQPLLIEAGFTNIEIKTLPLSDEARVLLDPGPLTSLGAHVDIAALAGALARATQALGIEHGRYPIEIARGGGTDHVRIDLPSAAIRSGALLPWSPLCPGRYAIEIQDDDREAGTNLESALRSAGFARAKRIRLGKISEGFVFRCGNNVPESIQDLAKRLVGEEMVRIGARDIGLSVVGDDCEAITIEFPARALLDGSLTTTLANPTRYKIQVIGASAEICAPLITELKRWGFRSVRCNVDPDDDPPFLTYGGAPIELLARIGKTVKHIFGIELPTNKAWPMTDHDICVRLPSSLSTADGAAAPALAKAARRSSRQSPRGPFIELTDGAVRIADVTLPRRPSRHATVQQVPEFAGFCIDQRVAETLAFLAHGIQDGVPLALEGATAASKTWPIQYLLALLGWPAYRLNLNTSSDASNIVGRFVPDSSRPGVFPWSYGPVPRAMIEGAAVIIDEANLAPSELLELLNPVLEPRPRLLLSEYDHRVIGDGDLHPDFRVLATWNNLSYAGRQELSPAFLDRFTIRIVQPPEEQDFLALGRYLVRGTQPDVVIGDDSYSGARDAAALAGLGAVPDIDGFLVAFARFQASMANAGPVEVRASAPGRPVLATRRSFVRVLERMRRSLGNEPSSGSDRARTARAAWTAISFFLLEGLDDIERAKAEDLAAACGIRPDGWSMPS